MLSTLDTLMQYIVEGALRNQLFKLLQLQDDPLVAGTGEKQTAHSHLPKWTGDSLKVGLLGHTAWTWSLA